MGVSKLATRVVLGVVVFVLGLATVLIVHHYLTGKTVEQVERFGPAPVSAPAHHSAILPSSSLQFPQRVS